MYVGESKSYVGDYKPYVGDTKSYVGDNKYYIGLTKSYLEIIIPLMGYQIQPERLRCHRPLFNGTYF